MRIIKTKSIKDLQTEFQQRFPGLKIEFYNEAHEAKKGSPNDKLYGPETKIANIIGTGTEGDMELDEKMTVTNFETEMKERFDLNVQVYRRSNDLWLQTITTDEWTLEVQNRKGIHSTEQLYQNK